MLQTLLLTVLWIVTKAIHLSNFISQYIYIYILPFCGQFDWFNEHRSIKRLSSKLAVKNAVDMSQDVHNRRDASVFWTSVKYSYVYCDINTKVHFFYSQFHYFTYINDAFRTIQHRAPVNKLHVSRWQKPSLVHSKSLEKNIVNVVSLLLPIEWTAQFFRMRYTVISEIDCHKETTPFLLAVTGL